MAIIDISQVYSLDMGKYPSISPLKHEFIRHYEKGDSMCLSQITMQTHLGTHVDAPFHYIKDGRKINELDLNVFYGPCQVIEIKGKNIDFDILKGENIQSERVLFKTSNSEIINDRSFNENYVYIEKSGAEYLAEQGVELVGLDYYSVDYYKNKNKDAHKILLGAGIILLEGIDLSKIDSGEYTISCFPLNFENFEGAPCRAVLIK